MKYHLPRPKQPQDLAAKIQHTDRLFRIAQTIFTLLVAVMIFVMILIQIRTQQQIATQSAERGRGILELQKHNDEELAKQSRYIECIAQFFARADRSTLVLEDLGECNILRNGQNVPGVDLTPTSTSAPKNTMPITASNNRSTAQSDRQGQSLQPTSPPPAAESEPAPAPAPQRPEPAAEQPAEQEPVKFLGIPLCVILTTICIR